MFVTIDIQSRINQSEICTTTTTLCRVLPINSAIQCVGFCEPLLYVAVARVTKYVQQHSYINFNWNRHGLVGRWNCINNGTENQVKVTGRERSRLPTAAHSGPFHCTNSLTFLLLPLFFLPIFLLFRSFIQFSVVQQCAVMSSYVGIW